MHIPSKGRRKLDAESIFNCLLYSILFPLPLFPNCYDFIQSITQLSCLCVRPSVFSQSAAESGDEEETGQSEA